MAKALTHEEFVIKLTEKHGGKYTSVGLYSGSKVPIALLCSEHGEFISTPNTILSRTLCPKCGVGKGGRSKPTPAEDVSKRLEILHPSLTFPLFSEEYINSQSKLTLVCAKHGNSKVSIGRLNIGAGCPKCGIAKIADKSRDTLEGWIAKARLKHGDTYDYSKSVYIASTKKIEIICREHGSFWQNAYSHTNGTGCRHCYTDAQTKRVTPYNIFVEKATEVHSGAYTYHEEEYTATSKSVGITCKSHGKFYQIGSTHLGGSRCPLCAKTISAAQVDIKQVLEQYTAVEFNYRYGVGKKEFDIYLPDYRIAIEYNGVYWHSSEFLPDNFHITKHEEARKLGIKLIQIYSDEWLGSKEAVSNILLNIVDAMPEVKLEDCKVVAISNNDAISFHSKYNIQPWNRAGASKGLKYNGELIAVMTLTTKAKTAKGLLHSLEMSRYSSKVKIVGGAAALLKEFTEGNLITRVVAFSDNRLGSDDLYLSAGFTKVCITKPSYTYTSKHKAKRLHKSHFRHSQLFRTLDGRYNPDLTERANCEASGYYQVYDCGLTKWLWEPNI